MKFSETKFDWQEFMKLPEYESKLQAPKDKTPFLIVGRQVSQKLNLQKLVDEVSNSNTKITDTDTSYNNRADLKVIFSVRHKDGNITDAGGYISFRGLMAQLGKVETTQANDKVFAIDTGSDKGQFSG